MCGSKHMAQGMDRFLQTGVQQGYGTGVVLDPLPDIVNCTHVIPDADCRDTFSESLRSTPHPTWSRCQSRTVLNSFVSEIY